MNGSKGATYGFTLLGMLAAVMGVHLYVLYHQASGCEQYERVLLQRLAQVPAGSLRAREIRSEIEGVLSGKLMSCRRVEGAFSDASATYTAILLSLLTGAGLAAGGAMAVNVVRSHRGEEEEPIRRLPQKGEDDES
jgi:hypothetical protein